MKKNYALTLVFLCCVSFTACLKEKTEPISVVEEIENTSKFPLHLMVGHYIGKWDKLVTETTQGTDTFNVYSNVSYGDSKVLEIKAVGLDTVELISPKLFKALDYDDKNIFEVKSKVPYFFRKRLPAANVLLTDEIWFNNKDLDTLRIETTEIISVTDNSDNFETIYETIVNYTFIKL